MPVSAQDIASLCLHAPDDRHFQVQLQSTEHRLAILSSCLPHLVPGAKILELGCGQGDTTTVLAELVGDEGHVTAVDPGSLDYGSPFTLGQAQSHLSAGRLGPRITWKQGDPLDFLRSESNTEYDVTVLSICIWYFASPSVLVPILRALSTRSKRIFIAEWSLSASKMESQPHVLAALTQAALECRKPSSISNVRTVLSPVAIEASAKEAGWVVESRDVVHPKDNVLDGKWEVQAVINDGFLKQVEDSVKDERERGVVYALRDSVVASVEKVGGIGKITSMDVWCAIFIRG
ncbi:S-adenosyl-L-methionine-dependent methyltransferase [Gymnopus androsaceus JB14]|uniref:S-adenosyl-L-methionine-dependent methyltransferase n=1 Tax=Gymnopus androsaceus JB14 TaxID=1447944 RepID=A0A6A4GNU6_9AGAR|nr:S-adenosyl-L-methionine-dependent methyltransferase [Gymnopus androsaceus JB14]